MYYVMYCSLHNQSHKEFMGLLIIMAQNDNIYSSFI